MSKQAKLGTAYHEAGHVAASIILHRRFKSVTIIPNEEALGHVASCPMPKRVVEALKLGAVPPKLREELEDEIIIYLAGNLGMRLVRKRLPRINNFPDYHTALDFAARVCGGDLEEVEAYFHWLYVRARQIAETERFKRLTRCIAEALMDKQSLDYASCMDIYREEFHLVAVPC